LSKPRLGPEHSRSSSVPTDGKDVLARFAKYPKAVERFLELPLSSQAKRKFLWDNCAKLYGFDA